MDFANRVNFDPERASRDARRFAGVETPGDSGLSRRTRVVAARRTARLNSHRAWLGLALVLGLGLALVHQVNKSLEKP